MGKLDFIKTKSFYSVEDNKLKTSLRPGEKYLLKTQLIKYYYPKFTKNS